MRWNRTTKKPASLEAGSLPAACSFKLEVNINNGNVPA